MSAKPSAATTRGMTLAGLLAVLVCTGCATGGVTVPASRPATAVTPPTASASETERALLAPSGRLRVGVYPGSPTSLVRDASGQARGVSVEVGQSLARKLGLPHEVVEFPRLQLVLDALKAGQVDITVTNATPARAADVHFTPALVFLELGFLTVPRSPVQTPEDVQRPGVKMGVSQGSTTQTTLPGLLKQAQVVPAPSLQAAREMLSDGRIDAFATNKGILFEMADALPGARVLPGRWGQESLAIAIPKGREAAMPFVLWFSEELKRDGTVQRAAERAGLRGTMPAP